MKLTPSFVAWSDEEEKKKARAHLAFPATKLNAEIEKLSDETGINEQVIQADPEAIERRKQADSYDLDLIRSQSPAMFKQLNNPKEAARLRVDLNKMSNIEASFDPERVWVKPKERDPDITGAVKQQWSIGRISTELSDLNFNAVIGASTPEGEQEIVELNNQINVLAQYDPKTEGMIEKTLPWLAGSLPLMIRSSLYSIDDALKGAAAFAWGGAAVGGAAGFVSGGPAGAVVGAAVVGGAAMAQGGRLGFAAGRVMENTKFMIGDAFNDYRTMKDQDGQLIDQNAARGAAIVVGIISGGAESFGQGKLLEKMPYGDKLIGKFGREAMRKAMRSPKVMHALARYGAGVGKTGLWESGTESFQEVIKILGEYIVAEVAEGEFETTSGKEAASRIIESAQAGFMVGNTLAAGGSSIEISTELARIRSAKNRAKAFELLAESTTDNTVLANTPKKYREFMENIRESMGDSDSVYMDGAELKKYFQENDVDMETVKDLMPDVYQQMNSIDTADISISLEDLAQHFAPQENFAQMYNHLKFNPDDLSIIEATKYEQEIQSVLAEYEALANQEDKAAETDVPVFNVMRDQLLNIDGMSEQDATTNAAIVEARYRVRAENLNIDPMELFKSENFSVQSEQEQGVDRLTRQDALLERLRNNEIPSQQDVFGKSLSQFFDEQGGLVDDGGELASRDLDKSQPSLNGHRLAREGGITLEEGIERAVEAGYITRDQMEGMTPSDLLDLIDSDIQGDGVFSSANENPENMGLAQELEMLEQILESIGVTDLENTTNEDIKNALNTYYQGQDQTETAEFKAWSGGAKVLDAEEINDYQFREGETVVVKAFHATTHDFNEFDASKSGNKGGRFGAVNYFTSSEYDANANYLADGVDLTARIDELAYSLSSEMEFGGEFNEVAERFGVDAAELRAANNEEDALQVIARNKIAGGSENVMEVYIKVTNPFAVNGRDQFIELFNMDQANTDAIEQIAGEQGVTVAELDQGLFEEEITERQWDLQSEMENPLREAIEAVAFKNDLDPSTILAEFYEYDTTATNLEEALREDEGVMYSEDETGGMDGSHIVAEIIRELGYDGIILQNADKQFSNMNMEQGTAHIHVFDQDNTNIKSVDNEGQFNPNDANIYKQGEKGYILTNDAGSLMRIVLTSTHDASTFLHESGHAFLFQMLKDATHENASLQMKRDAVAVNSWWERNAVAIAKEAGVEQNDVIHYINNAYDGKNSESIDTALNEYWARGFELYLRTGKAPTPELQGLFSKFKAWMRAVYRQAKQLRVDIDPEITEVFDRLLATEEEIKQAKLKVGAKPLFGVDDSGLMSDQELQDYSLAVEERTQQAEDELDALQIEHMMKMQSKVVRDFKKQNKEAAKEQVFQDIDIRARYLLMNGEFPTGGTPSNLNGIKLSKSSILSVFPDISVLSKLSRLYTVKGGADINMIAPELGYSSGMDLLNALKEQPNWSERTKSVLTEMAEQAYPDPRVNGELSEAAVKALHNDKSAQLINIELKILSGKTAPPLRIVKEAAKRYIEAQPLHKIRPDKYLVAEQKFARISLKAKADKDQTLSVDAKRKQLMNQQMHRESIKVLERFTTTRKRMLRLTGKTYQSRMGKGGQEFRVAINSLLESVDLKNISGVQAQRREILRTANDAIIKINALEDATHEIAPIDIEAKSWKVMTISELEDISNKAEELYAEARGKYIVIIDGVKQDFADLKDDLIHSMQENTNQDSGIVKLKDIAMNQKKKDYRQFIASHNKAEFLFKELDGWTEGKWWHTFMPMVQHAESKRAEMLTEYGQKIETILRPIYKTFNEKIDVPNRDDKSTRHQAFMMALNMGNEDSRIKLYDGQAKDGWSKSDVDAVVNNLTEQEFAAVQKIWDTLNEFWPSIVELEEKRNGYAPEKVEAAELVTPFGILEGGYFPLVYNDDTKFAQDIIDKAEKLSDIQRPFGTTAFTKKTHTKQRVEGVKKRVKLDISVIDTHITQVVQDLAFGEPVREMNKVLKDATIRSEVVKSIGRENLSQLDGWLLRVAKGEAGVEGVEVEVGSLLNAMRRNVTLFMLGYSLSTTLVQVFGITQSIDQLGFGVFREMLTTPNKFMENRDFALKHSAMMAERPRTLERDIKETIRNMPKGEQNILLKGNHYLNKFAFSGIAFMDSVVSIPTWNTSYKQSIAAGLTHDQAVDIADGVVRQTQGSGSNKDLSSIQSGSPALKAMTMFYHYFNSYYNMNRQAYGRAKNKWSEGKQAEAVYGAFVSYMLLTAIPAVVVETALGRAPDEDDDESYTAWAAKRAISYPFMGLIGVRDAVNAVVSGYDYHPSPVSSVISRAVKTDADDPFDIMTLTALFYPVALFSNQAQKLYNNIMAMSQDEELTPYQLMMIEKWRE